MDPELRAWTQKQDAAQADMAAEVKRMADQLMLLTREVANIAMMLAPKISEGPSPLEQLLAQLVAQGQEAISHLRNLAQQGSRIEAKLDGGTGAPPLPTNRTGNGKATRQ